MLFIILKDSLGAKACYVTPANKSLISTQQERKMLDITAMSERVVIFALITWA